MKKKLFVAIAFMAVLVLAFGVISTGAWWTVQTQATGNNYQAATFDMTIGGTGTHTVNGACVMTNMAPGDDPVLCKIWLHNAGSIPINVVWSGFGLTGDSIMQDWLFVTAFADSNGQTNVSQLINPTFDTNGDGKLSLKEIAPALANGYFSNPDGTNNNSSMFLAPGADGWVSLTLAFGKDAPNETIGKQAGFNWTLTGQQLPKNPAP
jgi:hypothetical protein